MWIPSNNKFGVAIHNWHGDVQFGLPLDVGDFVEILEECGPWFRGTCPRKPRAVGLFPQSYINLKDLDKADPVVAECTQVLREWSEIWKKLYVDRESYKFITLRKVMLSLLESRRELLGATLTQDQTLELQMKVISKIDWGNRKLGLDLVPRTGPLCVDSSAIGIVNLHQVHVNSAENAKASSSRGTLRRKAPKKILTHHLYLCLRDFGHRIGDDAEVYFYLYDGNSKKMQALSERFLVRISKDGISNYVEKLHSNCTVFSDLGASDLGPDLYLVANVMRVGKITSSDSVKKGDKNVNNHNYRRPYGVGVLPLAEIGQYDAVESEEKEFSFKLFQCDEKDFYQLHEAIIKKTSGKFAPLTTGGQAQYGLVVSLKLLHGGLTQARAEQPLLFQGTTITRKIGFPDVIMPGDVRNDLFITFERGEFERGGKSTAKNIEVSVHVLESTGRVLTESLWGASSVEGASQYRSMILYHNNSPCYNETLRISIPIDKFSGAHVRLEYRHCSTREKTEPKLFGFSFIRLMEPSGATLADGSHELYVYKCEDPSKLLTATYLKLPCYHNDAQAQQENSQVFHRTSKESFLIKSLLCSTKLTQNADLLSLLQWRSNPEKIQDSLTRVLRLKDEELVKFLQDVLDALFAMFSTEDGNSTAHSGLVFHVLVSIFSLLQNSKFQHFKPVIDVYIENHFAAALVYKGLLSSVQHCAEWMATADSPEPIQKCFESLEYIFKLIIQSRKLFARATGGQFEESFKRDFYAVFNSLNGMLNVTSYDAILPTQEALLHAVGVVFDNLIGTLPATELGALARNLLDSVPIEAQPRLIQAKLQAIKDLVSGELFHDDESRSLILSVACKHLRIHMSRRDELKLCSDILAEILNHLYDLKLKQEDKPSNTLQYNLDTLCKNVLEILFQTILIIMEGSPAVLSPLVAVLLGLLQQLDESHYKQLWDDLSRSTDLKNLKEFLHRSLLVFKEILTQDWHVFPSDWLVMKLAANNVIRKTLEEFAKPLVFRFLGQNTFDSQLWWSYFSLAVSFLTQPCLQLEQYHETKRRKILHAHGDMRVLMGFQILSMWSQLGEYKLHFIPTMVGPFLEVTLVPEPSLRKATLAVFYDMMHCEQDSRGSFRLVESELIDKLDLLINENKGDEEYRELFKTVLLERVENEDPIWKEAGAAFITSVTRLLERLLDYRSVMQGDENRDKRMSCTVNLLNFYKNEINRKEMYLRYIYKLHDLHLQAENFTEAGFTLKLYADMLSWDKEVLTFAQNDIVGQPEWQRKENLYHEIIHYFDKGKCWEKAIPLCKELATLYEMKRFDYVQLSNILKTQAKCFENILGQVRHEPEYFRVGFYGMGFPLFVRNKQFVYRGLEYERIGTFTQRLQTEFPQAQILTKNSPPDQTILGSPDQYIQISNVRPIADLSSLRSACVPVPDRISRFYLVNDVMRFQYDRPIHKGPVDKDNEFKSLWIERTILDISSPLPGILRWFEVTSRTVQEITPVDFACETMVNVNKELTELISIYKTEPKRTINPFSMRLQGVIDANVMGGISKYQEAFFSEAFLKSAQGQAQTPIVQKLKTLILEQLQILEMALDLHGQLVPVGVQPLHKRLVERFVQLRHNLSGLGKLKRQHSESIVNTPLPPLPIEKRAMSLGGGSATGVYESDDIYTRPADNANAGAEQSPPMKPNRESLDLPDLSVVDYPAPPIPARPKSAGYASLCESPEVPPKLHKDKPNAPPLPPRGYTPDKRASNPNPLEFEAPGSVNSMGRRTMPSQKYSVVYIQLDDENEHNENYSHPQPNGGSGGGSGGVGGVCDSNPDFRDSGISTSSNELNTMANTVDSPRATRGHHKTSSNPEVLSKIQNSHNGDTLTSKAMTPPPIPPKIGNSLTFELSDGGSSPSNGSRGSGNLSGDGYCVPKSNMMEQ